MPLNKTPVSINFLKGIETKTDPYQISIGSFSALTNSVFSTTGRLTKRNGYPIVATLPNTDQTVLTTLNDNLIATGANLYSYNRNISQWTNQGKIQPIQLSTQSLVRNSTSQVSPYMTIATNGLMCLVYMDSGNSYYHIIDSLNGQQVIERTQLPATAVNPKAFILGAYFIITFIATVSGTPTLQYIALNRENPAMASATTNISADVMSLNAGYDAQLINNSLYIAWGASSNTVKITLLTRSLGVASAIAVVGVSADVMSLTHSASNQRVFISYWEDSSEDGYTAAFTYSLVQVMAATPIITNTEVREITSVAQNGILNIYYETINTYSYSAVETDFISSLTVTLPVSGVGIGTASSPNIILRSVGLASKAFIAEDGTIYMMAAFDSANQPSYFLIDSLGNTYMRLAYSNGGGYEASSVLANIEYIDGVYYYPYQITDFLTTVNKKTDIPDGQPSNAIYTQTGIHLAQFELNNGKQYSSEIAGALHLTGGQMWEFDGVKPVELGFHVWPEDIGATGTPVEGDMTPQIYFYQFTYEWTDNQGNLHRSAPSIPYKFEILEAVSFTAETVEDSEVLINVSSFVGIQVGQAVTGTGIPADTYIVSFDVDAETVTLSNDATANGSPVTITPASLSSIELAVPTLRITSKVSPNPVRVVGYRWSEGQQVYYQFTSVTSPVLNNTTVDWVSVPDNNSDAQILGQTLLYTTGGVIENIAPPASIDSALFDNRLFLIDAEDQNVLWYSKQVIQNVPVETSDLLTIYVAPTTGTQGSTGPMKCIATMDDKLIIFKANALYYINGSGPDNAGANSTYSQPTYITGVAGSVNPNSIVLIPTGLMFQSNKGIWLLGRDLSTKYIGAPVEQFNDLPVLSAEAIPNSTEVRFIIEGGQTLMYDYYQDQWGIHTNVKAISACIYQNAHTYLNQYGQIQQETPGVFKDGANPVLMSLTTSWINIAGVQGYERFYFANLLGTYFSPFKLAVQLAYNYNPSISQSTTITPVDNVAEPYGGEAVWGSGPQWGGSAGNVFSARLFPEIQKCQSFQVTLQEIYDPSYGIEAGQGLALSGLQLMVGIKKGVRTQSAAKSFG